MEILAGQISIMTVDTNWVEKQKRVPPHSLVKQPPPMILRIGSRIETTLKCRKGILPPLLKQIIII